MASTFKESKNPATLAEVTKYAKDAAARASKLEGERYTESIVGSVVYAVEETARRVGMRALTQAAEAAVDEMSDRGLPARERDAIRAAIYRLKPEWAEFRL